MGRHCNGCVNILLSIVEKVCPREACQCCHQYSQKNIKLTMIFCRRCILSFLTSICKMVNWCALNQAASFLSMIKFQTCSSMRMRSEHDYFTTNVNADTTFVILNIDVRLIATGESL